MGWTAPRQKGKTVVALAHQTAFDVAASASGALVRAQCLSCDFQRGAAVIDPQGTTGSEFPRDTRLEVGTAPTATLRLYAGSRAFLAALLEHATHGKPTATSAAGDLVETGDSGSALTTWVLAGVRPGFNTSADFKFYVELTDENPGANQALVQLYSDSARTALVASGSHANNGTVTLAEQNSSGLSGTVALAAPSASNLTGIVLTVVRIRCARSTTIDRYFTLFRDTGSELEAIAGCTVSSVKFTSEQRGSLIVEAEIAGAVYEDLTATTITPALVAADKEYFVHAAVTFTHNAIAQSPLSIEHGFEHDVEQHLANSATPTAVFKTGSKCRRVEIRQKFCSESRAILDDGLAQTWRQVVATYTYGSKSLVFTYPACILVDPGLPGSREAGWDDHRLALEPRDDGTNDPVSITLDL